MSNPIQALYIHSQLARSNWLKTYLISQLLCLTDLIQTSIFCGLWLDTVHSVLLIQSTSQLSSNLNLDSSKGTIPN